MLNFHSSATSSPNALDPRFPNGQSRLRASHELPALKNTRGFMRSSMDAPLEPTFLTHSEVQSFANRCRFLTNNPSQSIDISSQMNSTFLATRRSNLSTSFKAASAVHPLFEPIMNQSGQQYRFPLKTIQEFGLRKQDIQLNKALHRHNHLEHNKLIANNYKLYVEEQQKFRTSTENKIHKENREILIQELQDQELWKRARILEKAGRW